MDITTEPRLGIDIGRVIIDGTTGGDTSFFGNDMSAVLATPRVEGSFEAITELTRRFSGSVWLVSKCGPRIQERSLAWLTHHGFWAQTGVTPDRVRFCRRRPEKRGICLDLGLTHFVDDHPEVHRALAGAVAERYLFGPQRSPAEPGVTATPTWTDVLRHCVVPASDDSRSAQE